MMADERTVGPLVAGPFGVVALTGASSSNVDHHHGNNHIVMDLKSIGDATAYPSRFVVDSTRAKHSLFDSNSSSNWQSRY